MTDQVKMPFYVVVENSTGKTMLRKYETKDQILSPFSVTIDAGTHRIEHIRDQSVLVEIVNFFAYQGEYEGRPSEEEMRLKAREILSRHGRE